MMDNDGRTIVEEKKQHCIDNFNLTEEQFERLKEQLDYKLVNFNLIENINTLNHDSN